MPTIAFVSSKGGVGKTTSALLLALGLAEAGEAVALVDSDPNLPLSAWRALSAVPAAVRVFAAPRFDALPAALRGAERAAPWRIIDTEGGAPRLGAAAVAAADLVIAPLAASHLEAREALKVKVLAASVAAREGRVIPFACLFARTPGGFRRSFQTVRAELDAAGALTLVTVLSDREAFRALFASGGDLASLPRREVSGVSTAQALVRTFAAEIREIFAG